MNTFACPSEPLVSIVVPVYNSERDLYDCVRCLINQTYGNIEIILVDDGSTDDSSGICDNLVTQDSRIKVIHKENQGLGMARNSGIENVSGKWVMFVDSDDLISYDTVEFLIHISNKYPEVDQIRFLLRNFSSNSYPLLESSFHKGRCLVENDRIQKLIPILGSISELPDGILSPIKATASACTALYKMEVINTYKLRFLSEREYISEDYIFNIEFAMVSGGIAFTDEVLYYYRISPKSLTHTFKYDRMEKSAFMCEIIEKRLRSMNVPYASDVAMGAMIVYMRAHFRHIFDSNLPLAEKRAHFRRVSENPMIRRIAREYRFPQAGLKQRVAFAFRRSYLAELMFIRAIDFVKSLLGH